MSQKKSKQQRAGERETARLIVAGKNKASRRRSLLIKVLVVTGVIAALTVTGFIIAGESRDEIASTGPVPDNGNVYGGIKLPAPERPDETDLHIDVNNIPPAAEGGLPAGITAPEEGGPARVVLYLDPNCVHCADFEETYGALLEARVQDGLIDLETRTVTFLDRASPSNFSSRAANAMACVADWAPEKYLAYSRAVFRTSQDSGEMSNKDLTALAEKLDVGADPDCITEGTFRPFVKFGSAAAEAHGITATPTVFINGVQWPLGGDLEAALPAAK